ncbi:hypothetical protein D3C77_581760 [compost metagenome]
MGGRDGHGVQGDNCIEVFAGCLEAFHSFLEALFEHRDFSQLLGFGLLDASIKPGLTCFLVSVQVRGHHGTGNTSAHGSSDGAGAGE